MKKMIFYPNLKQTDGKGIVTREEYREQLFEFYTSKSEKADEEYQDLLREVISFARYGIEESVGRAIGHYPDAVKAIEAIRSLSSLPIEEMNRRQEEENVGFIYPLAILHKGEPEENVRHILKHRCGIDPCDEGTILLAQEITTKVMEDIERATRGQMTFVQRFTPRGSDENKSDWANRVSEDSNSAAAQKSPTGKKVNFLQDL
jgi:hypothetical protein